jgi:hypothetical protein
MGHTVNATPLSYDSRTETCGIVQHVQQQETASRRPAAGDRQPAWAWLLVAALALLSGYLGALGSPYLDPVRDIYWAHRIASFAEWPLVGPEIGFFTHLGPIWYYLLAPALWIDASFTAVAAWAGLLQGSQFIAALALGRALGQWRCGLLLALLLALPGLTSFTYQSFNHFNLVPATVLGLLLAARRDWQQPGPVSAFVLGLMFTLMLHAHPATLALGWIVVVTWLSASGRGLRGLLLAAGAILPFVPLLFAAATDRLPPTPTGGALAHLDSHFDIASVAETPILLWHILVSGTRHGLILVTQGAPIMLPVLTAALLLILALALAGLPALVSLRGWREGAALLAVAIVLQTTAALLMRSEILWYMVLSVPTLALVLLAYALTVIEWSPLRRAVLPLTIAIGVGSLATLLVTLIFTNDDNGRRHFPAAFMMNLQAGADAGVSVPGPQLSFRGSDRLARALCSETRPLILHGAVAQQADTLTDLGAALHCPDRRPSPVIGGRPEADATRWLAVGPVIAEALDRPADDQLESLHFYPVGRVLYPARSEPLARAREYPPRSRSAADSTPRELMFSLPCTQPLLISNPYPWWAQMVIESVSADGRALDPDATDTVSRLYRPDDCHDRTQTRWQVRFRAPKSMPPDIVSIATSSAARSSGSGYHQHIAQ